MSEVKSGVLILNKPKGITSHDVVNRIRRLYGTKKVGHTGTLDPMATGVLPILVGSAVKASEYLVSDSKQYTARMLLGIETDTEDTDGKTLSTSDAIPSDSEVFDAVSSFLGEYFQTPPMYSALKIGGEKLCDLARRGITVEREARRVEVFDISAQKLGDREWEINAWVSKGTYIRTLVADIGKRLGCGGTMSALSRRISGSFTIEGSHTLEELEEMSSDERYSLLLPTEELFAHCERVTLPDFYTKLAKNGAEIYLSRAGLNIDKTPLRRIRMADADGKFFALGELREFPLGLAIKPIKFFTET